MYRKLQTLLFFFFFNFIYLFIHGCAGSSPPCEGLLSSCGKWGPLFIAVRGPLTIAASLVVEHRLQMRRLSSCGSRAQLLRGLWDLPRPGIEPVSPALAGRLSTTAPPGKPRGFIFKNAGPVFWQRWTHQLPAHPLQQQRGSSGYLTARMERAPTSQGEAPPLAHLQSR